MAVTSYAQDETVECAECGEQFRSRTETDAGHCLSCGGECLELVDIYGPDGLVPDPKWGKAKQEGNAP